jgi:two-component system, LytTR family, sensor kinase
MSEFSLTNISTNKKHLLFWIFYVMVHYILKLVEVFWAEPLRFFVDAILKYGLSICIFYLNLKFIFPFFLKRKKVFAFFFIQILILFTNGLIRFFFYGKIFVLFGFYNFYEYSLKETIIISIWWWLQYTIFATCYFIAQQLVLKQAELRIAENEKYKLQIEITKLEDYNTQVEKEKLQAELNFLRAQINPHFLQNCLNFIYSDTRKTNPNAADAVMLLSTIMRYSVADNAATGGMALLKDEISQVENVIQIHQLRFEQKLNISFNKEGQFEHKQIVPMILLTLVENLIKYGDLNNSKYPAKINCEVDENERKILFTASNKKAYTNDVISTGLGLKNIRERLSLIWGDNFTLQKEETDDYYTVKLCMPYTAIQDNINNTPKLNGSILNPKPLNT